LQTIKSHPSPPPMSSGIGDVSKMNFEPGSWQEAIYDVYVGACVGANHSVYHAKKYFWQYFLRPLMKGLGMRIREPSRQELKESGELKVIGVGYGRTGTYSLALALEALGFPTLHTQHLYENDEIFEMWTNEIFLPSIEGKKAELGYPDLDLVAAHGFQATTDLPMAFYFDQIRERFPNCKFILTTRENSEVWFRSWDVLTKSITQPARYASGVVTNVQKISFYLRWLFALINKDNEYLTTPFPLPDQDKQKAIASYEDHNRRVRETIPKDLLLEYNVKQGWEPLCNFLEIKRCPTIPFPKSNSARSVQVQSIFAVVFPLMVILFITFYLFVVVFQRVTGLTVLQWLNCKVNEFGVPSSPCKQRKKA